MERERSEAFERLRPVCVALTRDHTRDNVQKVIENVKTVKKDVLQELQEYVLFPLRFIFKQQQETTLTLREDLVCDVCECLGYVLTYTQVSRWEMFQDLFTSLTCVLGSPDGIGKVVTSEELKLAVVQAFAALLKSAEASLIQTLFNPASLPPLGHAVSVLLRLIETEKSREIQLAAMDGLLCLSQVHSKSGRTEKVTYGNIFASFLPGIAMTLSRVITGDSKQGHVVISKAVEVFWKLTCLVLGDSLLEQAKTDFNSNKPSRVKETVRSLVVERSEDWVKMTASKMAVLIRQISSVKSHSSWRVRLALVNWADRILHNCSMSLHDSVPVLLEVLVGLIGDDYPNVFAKSRSVLETYKSSQANTDNARSLTEILEENLHALTTSLPRQIRMADEDQKLCTVNLLTGYITLLGPNINSLLRSRPHLHRLSMALVQALDLDCRDVHIVEERTTLPGYDILQPGQTVKRPRKTFHHFRDERTEAALITTCHILGHYGDRDILTDHFLDVFHESQVYKMSSTLILNEILSGVTPSIHKDMSAVVISPEPSRTTAHLQATVRMLIEEYLSPTNFNLLTTVTSELRPSQLSPPESVTLAQWRTKSTVTVATLNQNIVQMSLYLEGFGKFSLALGPAFQPLLIDVLYPLLEKLGHENAVISSAAYNALVDICQACQYRSLDELIRQNADYLMNSISLRLRHLEANPNTPLVLQVMLQYSEADILPLIDDTIQEILSCLDDHYLEESAMFLRVLYSLTAAINRWFPPEQQQDLPTEQSGSGDRKCEKTSATADEIREFFLDYHRQKEIADGNVEKDDYEDVTPGGDTREDVDNMETDRPTDLPKHVSAVKQVLIRSKHLLSSSCPRLRLLVLDTVDQAVRALQAWKNELLPLVHDLWRPFVARFTDEEKLVTIKAVRTLRTLCEVSGDFLQSRIFKDVTTKLESFLVNQARISTASAQAYQYTVNFKLQLTYLSCFGTICRLIKARDIDVDEVASSYLPYLSCEQPRLLQEAAITGLQDLVWLEPDVLWLKLSDLYTPADLSPAGSEFKPIKLLSPAGQRNQFTDNVVRLLPLTWTKESEH